MSDLGNKEIFAKNLKYYMNYYKKDRTQVADDIKVPYTTFNDWYNAITYPRIDKIELLSNYFNIKKSDLIEDKKKNDINKIIYDYGNINPIEIETFKELFEKYQKLSKEDKDFINVFIDTKLEQKEKDEKNEH